MTRNLQGFIDYTNSLPTSETPQLFGLHRNTDITYQITMAKGIVDTILSEKPKDGASQGGEKVTRDHKEGALDSVVLQCQITRLNKEDVTESPAEALSMCTDCSSKVRKDFV
ncbi:hypothetical protein DMENIID0001_130000 [Sergentomyia squamirostris]